MLQIGIKVWPNLSNADCDVHTSKTDSLSRVPKTRVVGAPPRILAPALFRSLMHSSVYFSTVIPAGAK